MRALRPAGAALLIAVAAAACYDSKKLAAPDDIMTITAAPASIAGDGFTRSQITAHVDPATNRPLKYFFAASGGTLSIAATDSRTPDANGDMIVFLTSDAVPKTVVVTVEARDADNKALASRSTSVTFTQASAESVLRLAVSPAQVDADGASSVQLRADVNPAATNRKVSFKTTNGSFDKANDTTRSLDNQEASADGVVFAQLYAPTSAGSAVVTATVAGTAAGASGFAASQTVTFVPALPDFIQLEATPLEHNQSETEPIMLKATLSRPLGKIAVGTRVDFSIANDASGQSFGRFQNVSRSKEGDETVGAQFVPGAAAPLGLATITARVPGTNVVATIKINIIM